MAKLHKAIVFLLDMDNLFNKYITIIT
jgi:hypothetical protein